MNEKNTIKDFPLYSYIKIVRKNDDKLPTDLPQGCVGQIYGSDNNILSVAFDEFGLLNVDKNTSVIESVTVKDAIDYKKRMMSYRLVEFVFDKTPIDERDLEGPDYEFCPVLEKDLGNAKHLSIIKKTMLSHLDNIDKNDSLYMVGKRICDDLDKLNKLMKNNQRKSLSELSWR